MTRVLRIRLSGAPDVADTESMVLLGMLLLATGLPPIAQPGEPIASPATSTLFAPGSFHAVVRVPRLDDRLYIAGHWSMLDLRVTIDRGATRTVLHGTQLPGARYGVALPADAPDARAVIVDGSAVNGDGGPILVTASGLYARSVTEWPSLALFGMLAGLACIAALIALAMRSGVLAWYAALLGTEAASSFNVLGAVRPPALVNQPLHAVMVALVLATSLAFARAYLGKAALPRRALIVAIAVSAATWAFVAGGDLWQDRWPSIPAPFDVLAFGAPDITLLVIAAFAVKAGRRDVLWYAASIVATIIGFLMQDYPAPIPGDVLANAAGVVALSCGLALTLRDREEERRRLETAVRIDALTGLANRRTLDATLLAEWSRGQRAQQPLAVVMIDVDEFKRYNDRFGHPRGDVVLQRVAGAIAGVVQRGEDCAARYGGEEFAAVLPAAGAEAASEVAERIRRAVEALGIPNAAGTGNVTVSCGVAAIVPTADGAPEELVSRADGALYEAKRAGRNRVATASTVALPGTAEPSLSF